MSNSIRMDLLRLELLPEALVNLTLDKEHTSLRWDHKSAKITLSCLPFPLEQQFVQISWSYIICIAPQTNTELDQLITDVKAQAQSLSDCRILPSSWEFGADSIVVLEPSASPDSWWSGSANQERLLSPLDCNIYVPADFPYHIVHIPCWKTLGERLGLWYAGQETPYPSRTSSIRCQKAPFGS